MLFRKTLLLFTLFFISQQSFSQIIWTEDFQNGCASACTAAGVNTVNGPWTITFPGFNGAEANVWYVSGAECGNAAAACGSVCGATDPSLHIGSSPSVLGDNGAAYLAGGMGFWDPITDARAESPTINLTGQNTITLNFNYIENGDGANDDASLWYFDGVSWTLLNALAKTALTCNPQGTWTAFSVPLPASANNNPNVKIGFRWVNNDDNIGTDPSFAVDDITLSVPLVGSPPVADFNTGTTNICVTNCVTFNNTSTFVAGATFNWTFTGGTPSSSTAQNPPSICYNTAGTYNVSLSVTDANGNDLETKTNYIVVTAAPNAGANNTANLCNNTTLNINTLLSGADAGGTWAETTGSPSGQFNTTTGVFDANGLTPGNYTFTYTVGSAPCTPDVSTFTITVNNCGAGMPVAIITASNGTVCQGQSLIFNSASTGTIVSYSWSFGGGIPGTASTAGPHNVTFTSVGTYNVQLTVTDNMSNVDDTTITIQVVSCSTPIAAFSNSDDDPCAGSCITFNNNTTEFGTTTYQWTFNGGTPATSTLKNPGQVCFDTPGNYTVTLVATNQFGSSNFNQNITVLAPPVITATGDATIDLGESTNITATTSEGTISWDWSPLGQGNILDCTIGDCSQATVNPSITTYFYATAESTEGCIGIDTVLVTVTIPPGGYAIGVPAAFSPNKDGNNDVLYVNGIGITKLLFKIYNRYGQLVFESDDQGFGWDGTLNQKELNPATFAWTLEYTLVNGDFGNKNGNVTLVK